MGQPTHFQRTSDSLQHLERGGDVVRRKKALAALEKRKRRSSGGISSSPIDRKIQDRLGGFWLFNYYLYMREYPHDPVDWDDLFDGLDAMVIMKEIEVH